MTALSGNGFFYLTRSLVLAVSKLGDLFMQRYVYHVTVSQMATTIITYELMISDVINQATIRQRTVYC